ncbi:MAG: hypothetical protein IGBAC_1758 [Ignavibacteriae bacterium]|nr:MAG: hypothetical protein IGBAC_1758 [Ignavibacteriota bacterium]
MDQSEKNEFLLMQLILMFQTTALQQMGKLKNPLTDKIEKNLEMAQTSIDILDMLHQKMKGNLSENEEKLFIDVLKELKLNYVDEVSKEQKTN